MLTQQVALKTAQQFAQEVAAENVGLKKAILFGSFVRNEQHEYSDIDICLVADEFSGFGFDDMKLILKVLRKDDYLWVQTKTYSTADYLDGLAFVEEEINPKGIVLFDNLTAHQPTATAAA